MSRPKGKRLPARLYGSVKADIDRAQRDALVECIDAGLPAMVERYGWHSTEVRGLEDLKMKLGAVKRVS